MKGNRLRWLLIGLLVGVVTLLVVLVVSSSTEQKKVRLSDGRLFHIEAVTFGTNHVVGVNDWWLVPLIVPVEILSTCARLLSLTVRLWANIFASDMIYGLFLSLMLAPAVWGWEKSPVLGVILGIFPALIPLAFIGLHIFVSIVQTYVFTILPAVYIGLATAEEH